MEGLAESRLHSGARSLAMRGTCQDSGSFALLIAGDWFYLPPTSGSIFKSIFGVG